MSSKRQLKVEAATGFRPRPLPAMIRQALVASAGALLVQGATLEDAFAGPVGGNVVAGQGQINAPDATTTVIQQQSSSLVVNWQTFNVAKNELVQFNQPSPSASALNRVLNQTPSQIFGAIRSNGKVFLLNGGGVVIGKSARVNVGSFFVTSLDTSNDDFMNGTYKFAAKDGSTPGTIVNRGLIQAATGGSVSLVGGQVANEGVIIANAGHVTLAAGRTATVDFNGDGLIHFEVDGKVLENTAAADAAVSNSGEIRTDGGQVLLAASTAKDVFNRAINNTGLIRAGGIQKVGGKVMLTGSGAGVRNSGIIDASGTRGGEVRMVSDSVIEQFGTVRADASAGSAGRVHLASLDTTLVAGDSVTSAVSDAGKGGLIGVLGERVAVYDNATVDASGATGGGTILVGGGYQGADASVANATAAFIGPDATLTADALASGDGGTVIVWSEQVSRVHGALSARGGRASGDGGLIETSSRQDLDVTDIRIDASARAGDGGLWLLDPFDVTIVLGANGVNNVAIAGTPNFAPTGMGADVSNGTINAVLDGGTDVSISTAENGGGGGGTEQGNVLQNADAPITNSTGTARTLTIFARGNITLSGGIAGTAGNPLSVVLDANDSNDSGGAQGTPAMAANGDVMIDAAITTFGGNFTASGAAFNNTGGIVTTAGGAVSLTQTGEITLGAAIDAGATSATISSATGAVNGGGTITADTVDLDAVTGIGNTAALSLAAGAISADTTGGNIDIDNVLGTAATVSSLTTSGAGAIAFDQSGAGGLLLNTVSSGAGSMATLSSAADINRSGGGTITADTVDLDAVTGIGNTAALSLAAGAISADTTGGNIDIDNVLGTAATVSSLTTSAAGTIAFDQSGAGGLLLNTVSSGAGSTATLSSAVDINRTGGGTLTADTVDLDAVTGIGNTAALSLVVGAISADTTTGNIDIDNALGTTTTLSSLTTSAAGTIAFDQSGAGGLLLNTVSSGAGSTATLSSAVDINRTGGGTITATTIDLDAVTGIGNTAALSLAAGAISADTSGGNIDIDNALGTTVTVSSLTTSAAGTIAFDQSGAGGLLLNTVSSGAGSTATLSSAVDINRTGGGTLTADTVDLDAVTGIGNTAALSLAAGAISADTTTGNIDIDNVLGTAVTVSSLTTSGAGTIAFDHSGAGGLLLNTVSAGAGSTATLSSALDINRSGGGTITADTVDLDAVTGIGNTAALSLAAGAIGADTTTGNIDIDNALGTMTTLSSLTTTGTGTITFDQTGTGGLLLNTVSSGAGSTATLSSALDINRTGGGTITADTVDLDAVTGIGNTAALSLVAGAISADTTGGSIDIDNVLATTTTVSSLTTAGAGITFDQTGLGDASFATVTTSGANAVTLNAQAGLSLTAALGVGNAMVSLNADSDNVDTGGGESGTLNLGGSTITTTGDLSLTAFNVGTTATITPSPSSLTLNFTRAGNLTLGDEAGGGPSLSDAAMDEFTTAGGGTLLLSTGGGIVLDRATAANGNLTLSAGTTITDNNNALAWQNMTGTLTLTAGGDIGIDVDGTLQVDLAGLTVIDGGTLNVTNTTSAGQTTAYQLGTNTALDAVTAAHSGGVASVASINSGGTLSLSTTGGANVILAGATAASTATINSAGNINGGGTITATTVDLDAMTGLGNVTALSLAAGAISADTTGGNIDIDNALGSTTTVSSLTTTGADTITFEQTGAGALLLNTVMSGVGSTATLSSAVDINRTGGGTITATTIDLDAATGLGNTAALSLAAGAISADTTAGNIDIDNALGTTTTVSSLTTSGAGTIAFDQSGAGGLLLNTVSAGGGSVTLNNTQALSLGSVNTGGGALALTNAGTVSVAGASVTGGGPLTISTTAGAINGAGGSLSSGAGLLTLDAAAGIGTAGAVSTITDGDLVLTANGGNIAVNDNGFSTSQLSLNTSAAPRAVILGGAANFNTAGIGGTDTSNDTVTFTGDATISADINTDTSLIFASATPLALSPGVSSIDTGAGSLTLASGVGGTVPGPLTLAAASVLIGSGAITMPAASALTINAPLAVAAATTLTTDLLTLGGAVSGPGDLSILSVVSTDRIIGGADPLLKQSNLDQFAAYAGTLNIGGTRDTPAGAANLPRNVTVSGLLKTAGDFFLVAAGDVEFVNGATPGQGRIESTKADAVVSVAALGSNGVAESGNITDTAAFASAGNPVRLAIVAGSNGTVELLASNQIGREQGNAGGQLNLSAATVSAAQVAEGDVQIDNANLSAVSGDTVLEIQNIYAIASAPGGPLAGVFNDAFRRIGDVSSVSVNTVSTPKQSKDELGFIDEGVFLLPSAFTTPERALLMPVLGDPDFPGDQRPEDPDDDGEWLVFFEDVVREFIVSRFPLAENAGVEERTAVEAVVTSELQTVIEYYEDVRQNERLQLAAESAAEELGPATNIELPGDPQQDAAPGAVQQGAVQGGTMTLGYVGMQWTDGGIGFEVRG